MRRYVLAAAAAVSLAVAAAAVPASGATKYPTAVKGSLQQTFVAQRYLGKVQQNKAVKSSTPMTLQAQYIGRKASEPTIGVDSKGVAFMTASTFDNIVGQARTEVRRSTDGGRSWKNITTEVPVVKSMPPATLDPLLWLDKKTNRLYNIELTVEGAYLQWTDDKGESWTAQPLCCGNPVNDHQTFAGGPPPAGVPALPTYPNVLYYCFNRIADSSCARSMDGGLVWTPTGAPAFNSLCPNGGGHVANYSSSAIEGHLVVDKRGWVWVPYGHCGKAYLALSKDMGTTWTTILVHESFGTASDAVLGQNHTAVDVDEAGNVYYVWWTDNTLPLMSVSKDGGTRWSAPVMIAPPGVKSVNFPTIAAGKKGQIAIIFPGAPRRYDYDEPDRSLPWNLYVMTSVNADAANPTFHSATANPANDPIHRGPCQGRCGGMFDFLDVVFAPNGEIWAAGTDNCTKTADCIKSKDTDRNASTDGQGLAIRQLAGPNLKKTAAKAVGVSTSRAVVVPMFGAPLLAVLRRRSRRHPA